MQDLIHPNLTTRTMRQTRERITNYTIIQGKQHTWGDWGEGKRKKKKIAV